MVANVWYPLFLAQQTSTGQFYLLLQIHSEINEYSLVTLLVQNDLLSVVTYPCTVGMYELALIKLKSSYVISSFVKS